MATLPPNPLDDVGDPNRPEIANGDPVAPQGSDITKDAGIPSYLADEQPDPLVSGFPAESPAADPLVTGKDGKPPYIIAAEKKWVDDHPHDEVMAIQGQDSEAQLRVQQADDATAAGVANVSDYEAAVEAVTVAAPAPAPAPEPPP